MSFQPRAGAFWSEPAISSGPKPFWQTRDELFAILREYRKWYDEGLSDVEISARMRIRYPMPESRRFNKPYRPR